MKTLLQLEEAALFLGSLFVFRMLDLSWWWFGAFILVPDIGMLGYLVSNKTGAHLYNLCHHRGLALLIYFAGLIYDTEWIQFAGVILFAHATLDRMLGYGLKYEKGFRYTHLGTVGKGDLEESTP